MTLTLIGWVYFFCFFLGLCYMAGSFFLVAGGGGDHGHDAGAGKDFGGKDIPGGDASGKDGGHQTWGKFAGGGEAGGHPDYPVWSPLNIAMSLTTFGAVGTVLNAMGLPTHRSFPVSTVVGLGTWAAVFYCMFKFFRITQSSSEPSVAQLAGKDAAVTIGIPEGGLGEVAYVARGARYNAPARSQDRQPLAAGTQAVIVRVEDGVCVVKPSVEEKLKHI